MTLIPLVGTYERKLDTKNRIFLPSIWSETIVNYKEFFFYQPADVSFLSVISQEHFERNKEAIFGVVPSPLLCTKESEAKYVKEITSRYGPVAAKINTQCKNLRLAIPMQAPFLNYVRENKQVTLIGGLDYFTVLHGSIDELISNN